MNQEMASRSPSGKLPQSGRKSFFKRLATDIKGRRDAIRAEDVANPFTDKALIRNSSWDRFDNDSTRSTIQCPTMPRHSLLLDNNGVSQSRISVANQDFPMLRPNKCPMAPLGDFNANLVSASPSRFEEPSLDIPRRESVSCAGRSLGHSTDNFTDSSCEDLLTRAGKWNVWVTSNDDISVRARLLDLHSNTSTTVVARVEWKNDRERYFVIRTGTLELQAFPLSGMKLVRMWGVNPLERIVAISIPCCDSDGFHAVSLKLESLDCLERLSRMTGLGIVG